MNTRALVSWSQFDLYFYGCPCLSYPCLSQACVVVVVGQVAAPETMGVLNFPSSLIFNPVCLRACVVVVVGQVGAPETMGVLNFPLCRKLWVSLIFLNFPSYGCP